MCYKQELQDRNEAKLEQKLNDDNVPMFIRDYLEDIDSKAGAINYWSALKDFMLWLIDEEKIDKDSISNIMIEDFNNIYPQHISKYLRQKEVKGMSPTTLETRKNIIRSFLLNVSYYKESTIGDIKKFFKMVKYKGVSSNNNLVKKLPTDEQLKTMEERIVSKNNTFLRVRNFSVLRVLKGSGIRESELTGLDMDDLFLDEEIPHIKILGKGIYRQMESRNVLLTNDAKEAIEEWLEERNKVEGVENIQAVFITQKKKRLSESEIRSIFKNYSDGVTPHMIRHWYATVMAQKCGVVFAQQQLGHSSMNTTVNNYANGSYGMKDILASM